MYGHPPYQAKVSLHGRWPLVGGTGERRGSAKHVIYTLHDYIMAASPPAMFILITMACIVINIPTRKVTLATHHV